jgi:hypothetical protein
VAILAVVDHHRRLSSPWPGFTSWSAVATIVPHPHGAISSFVLGLGMTITCLIFWRSSGPALIARIDLWRYTYSYSTSPVRDHQPVAIRCAPPPDWPARFHADCMAAMRLGSIKYTLFLVYNPSADPWTLVVPRLLLQ